MNDAPLAAYFRGIQEQQERIQEIREREKRIAETGEKEYMFKINTPDYIPFIKHLRNDLHIYVDEIRLNPPGLTLQDIDNPVPRHRANNMEDNDDPDSFVKAYKKERPREGTYISGTTKMDIDVYDKDSVNKQIGTFKKGTQVNIKQYWDVTVIPNIIEAFIPYERDDPPTSITGLPLASVHREPNSSAKSTGLPLKSVHTEPNSSAKNNAANMMKDAPPAFYDKDFIIKFYYNDSGSGGRDYKGGFLLKATFHINTTFGKRTITVSKENTPNGNWDIFEGGLEGQKKGLLEKVKEYFKKNPTTTYAKTELPLLKKSSVISSDYTLPMLRTDLISESEHEYRLWYRPQTNTLIAGSFYRITTTGVNKEEIVPPHPAEGLESKPFNKQVDAVLEGIRLRLAEKKAEYNRQAPAKGLSGFHLFRKIPKGNNYSHINTRYKGGRRNKLKKGRGRKTRRYRRKN